MKDELVSVDDILSGVDVEIPTEHDKIYLLIGSIISRLEDLRQINDIDDVDEELISKFENAINSSEESDLINVGSLTIDKTRHRVVADGEEISLTAREFDILYLMASNKGRVFSSEEIFEKVWKEKYFQSNNTVMVHISRLRDKLDKHLNGEKIIHTVWGVGYKIEK